METASKEGNKSLIGAIGLAVFIVILFFKGCGGNGEKTVPVKLPEVKGKFEAVKPEQKPIDRKHIVDSLKKVFRQNLSKKEIEYWKSEAERLLNEYDKLDIDFQQYNDSTQQLKYREVITPKAFSKTWDNDDLKATVRGLYLGKVIPTVELDYTIKSRTVEVPKPKEVVFRMLGGVEVGNTTQFNDFRVKANFGFQNRSGAILSIGADTEQRFYVGYTVPIFTIKR